MPPFKTAGVLEPTVLAGPAAMVAAAVVIEGVVGSPDVIAASDVSGRMTAYGVRSGGGARLVSSASRSKPAAQPVKRVSGDTYTRNEEQIMPA